MRLPQKFLIVFILLFGLFPATSEMARTEKRSKESAAAKARAGKGKASSPASKKQQKKGAAVKGKASSTASKKPQRKGAAVKGPVSSSKKNSASKKGLGKQVASNSGGQRAASKSKPVGTKARGSQHMTEGRTTRKSTPVRLKSAAGRTAKNDAAAKNLPQSRTLRLKQSELDRIREDIRQYESRLAESRKKERNTLERLDLFDRQTSLIRKVVSHLSVEIEDNKREIDVAQSRLRTEEQRLTRLKASYARYLVSAYKRGKAHDTELLLTSTSLNHMFIRSKYLKAFTGRQKSEAEEIRERQEAVQAQKMLLESKVVRQRSTVNAKQGEELTLKRKAEEHKELLDQVREDKAAYQAELKRKQAAAAKIERLIADLIERERAKRAESNTRKGGSTPGIGRGTARGDNAIASLPSRAISETAFGRLKGQLPWPLAEGRLVTGFGDQTNPKLGTVIPSNGIDIAASPGAAVRVVADGTISMLYFIAGYGNLLIVNHDDGFRTVYAHLSGISVREGQRVRAGQTIARSAEGITGAQVHFELWREKNKLNPLSWLARR